LKKIKVSHEVTPKDLITLITTGKGNITFSSEDFLPRGVAHNNTLYLTVTYLQKYVGLVLVDNDLAVNVCPWRTAKRLVVKKK